MTAVRKRLRIARILAPSAFSNKGWFGYAPLGRPLTRRERLRAGVFGSRAMRVLALPVSAMKAPIELGER